MRGSRIGAFRAVYEAEGFVAAAAAGGFRCFWRRARRTRERLVKMGARAERVRVMGNLKYDVRAARRAAMTERIAELRGGRWLVVGGSTACRGEERCSLEAWQWVHDAWRESKSALLMIAPRHPDRFQEVGGG